MALPKELTPNPVVGAIVECRFKSEIDRHKLLPLIMKEFIIEFPDFEEGRFPYEFKSKNEELKYYPDFTLKNNEFSIGFGTNAVTLEITDDYPLWEKYFDFVSSSIEKLLELGFITEIESVGLRFISFFPSTEDVNIGNIVLNLPLLDLPGYKEEFKAYQSHLIYNDINSYVQIFKDKQIFKGEDEEVRGTVIDIDASVDKDLTIIKDDICRIVNELHLNGKNLFFSLIKEDFLETRNPRYD